MLNHQGTNEIVTKRLLLRRYRVGDHEAMYRNWAGDPAVTRYLTWDTHASSAVSRDVIALWVDSYQSPTAYHWGITLDGELIGDIAVVKWNEDNACAEIGYCLSRRFWGAGIMTEALGAVIDYLFDRVGFHRISLTHDAQNPASGRVMQKCGMTWEGVMRHALRLSDGEWRDIVRYGMLCMDDRPWRGSSGQ